MWGGRASAHTMRYMATVTAIRHNPTLPAHCMRLCRRGKPGKVVIVAAMRKLLLLHAVIRDRIPWQRASVPMAIAF